MLFRSGDGKADLWRTRHAIRYLTYAIAPLLWRRGVSGRLLLLIGGVLYTRRPYERLAAHIAGLGPLDVMYAVMLVPVIRLVGDAAKMLGYPVGVAWRMRQWTSRSSS